MLDAADVLVDGQPAVRLRRIERRGIVVRIGVAQEVPRRARERVHRIGLAVRRTAAHRAGRLVERLVVFERLALRDVNLERQHHGQVLFGNRHDAAFVAMDRGDGIAPVALARDEPVAQAELDLAATAAHGLEVGYDSRFAFRMLAARHAGVRAGLHEDALGIERVVPRHLRAHALGNAADLGIERIVLGQDDRNDGQIVFAGELEIALIAARRRARVRCRARRGDRMRHHPAAQLLRHPRRCGRPDRSHPCSGR